ncbi:DUF899 domain-containing protein [Cohnella sp. REN36]|uniref:DUF899 domain-containing protein n=1 Tax=Cohnella sp. REN36 TaxID=2887347 RepID=UPI001D1534C3|nr:DUF899 domain-containing protein [Cohnella sp. REN36]MCC3373685.1 DUF899 domain-containing protein [Cohnella sp. REN36]
MTTDQTALPPVVPEDEWRNALEKLLVKEKELTRALDSLAAERRRLPMVRFDNGYAFEGPNGTEDLLDLFDGRRQLIVYHFMMDPGSDHRCRGCSSFVDNIGHLAHLHARDTTFVLVSPAPLSQIEPYKKRMGWSVPWFSSNGYDFNLACGVGKGFGLSVFLRDNDRIFRTYFTTSRGVDRLRVDFNFLDLTPFGRQEDWEDSPEGWPQTPPYTWWRLHDEYEE